MQWLRSLLHRKRRSERLAAEGEVYLFSTERLLGRARLVDISETGCRLEADEPRMLAQAACMLNPETAKAYGLQAAWTEGREVGYSFSSVRSVRGFVSEPDLAPVAAFWASVADGHGRIAPGGAFRR